MVTAIRTHSTHAAPCGPPGRRTAAAGAAFLTEPGRPRPGWCSGYRLCAGRHGPYGRRTPCRPRPDRGERAASLDPAGGPNAAQDDLELRRFAALSGRDHNRHVLVALLDGQALLGGRGRRASVRARDRPARWRCRRAAPSAGSLFPRPGGMLVGAHNGGIDVDVPGRTIRCQVPIRCQRQSRSYARPQGPYFSGTSRQVMPVRARNRMPSISRRRVHIGGRPGFLPLGNSGSSTAHCTSVGSASTPMSNCSLDDPEEDRTAG